MHHFSQNPFVFFSPRICCAFCFVQKRGLEMERRGEKAHALIAKQQPTNPSGKSERPYEGVQGACAVFMMRYAVVTAIIILILIIIITIIIIMSKTSLVDQGCIQAFPSLFFRHVAEFKNGW